MPNLLKELKSEITRLAKKEVKKSVSPLRKRTAELVRALAKKKRRVAELEKRMTRLERITKESRPAIPAVSPEELKKARIGPKLIKAQRKRLKINQEQLARLLKVSPSTVRAWEQGRSKPKDETVATFVAVRKMKVCEVRDRLGITPKRKKRVVRKRRGGRRGRK